MLHDIHPHDPPPSIRSPVVKRPKMRTWEGAGRPHSFAVKQNEDRDDAAIWQWASGIIRMRRMFISNGTCVVNRLEVQGSNVCSFRAQTFMHRFHPCLMHSMTLSLLARLSNFTTFNTHFANMCLFLGRKDSSSVMLSLSPLAVQGFPSDRSRKGVLLYNVINRLGGDRFVQFVSRKGECSVME